MIKTSQGLRFAPIETVATIDPDGKTVALTMTPKEPAPPEESALFLIADLLDKQIVDVDGRKVVRINDLEIARAGGCAAGGRCRRRRRRPAAPPRPQVVREALYAGHLSRDSRVR